MKKVTIEEILYVLNNTEKLAINDKNLDSNLPEMGMDSITFIQVIVSLEETFGCEIPDHKLLITEMDTVRKMFTTLCDLYNDDVR